MVIYEKPGYIRVVYRQAHDVIVFDWTRFTVTLSEIQELHQKALATAQAKRCYYFIAETSKVRTVLSDDIIRWWGEVWVPKLVEGGIRAIVTVIPTNDLATSSTRTWQAGVVGGITMENVTSFSEALVVVKTLQAEA